MSIGRARSNVASTVTVWPPTDMATKTLIASPTKASCDAKSCGDAETPAHKTRENHIPLTAL